MAHLGKRRLLDTDFDDYSNSGAKRIHASSTFSTPLQLSTVEDLQMQVDSAVPGFGASQNQLWPTQMTSTANHFAHPQPEPAAPATACAPVQCTDLIVYQPQHTDFNRCSVMGVIAPHKQHQQLQAAGQLPSPHQYLQQDPGTAQNDNRALKSVWRSLTPAQRRSLAGMWDVIKNEELLPRLVPQSGLLRLPSKQAGTNPGVQSSMTQQQQQQQQHTIIEELEDDAQHSDGKQGQHSSVTPNRACLVANGFTAAAAPPAGLRGVQLQALQQQHLADMPPCRQPSVDDMEL